MTLSDGRLRAAGADLRWGRDGEKWVCAEIEAGRDGPDQNCAEAGTVWGSVVLGLRRDGPE